MDYLHDRLNHCQIPHARLGEFFTPTALYSDSGSGITYIGEVSDLAHTNPNIVPMSIQSKISLYSSYQDQPNLIKHMVRIRDITHIKDVMLPAELDYLASLKTVAWIHVHRDDLLDQFLSYCLAERSNIWHLRNYQEMSFKEKIKPFHVDPEMARLWCQHQLSCDHIVERLDNQGLILGKIRYSNMKADCDKLAPAILYHIGAAKFNSIIKWTDYTSHHVWSDADDAMAKLWMKHEKLALVLNLAELIKIFRDYGFV